LCPDHAKTLGADGVQTKPLYLPCIRPAIDLYEKVYVPKSVIVEFGVSPFIYCAEVVDVRSKLIIALKEELNLGLGERPLLNP
uniref:hypothetical protein n=1 Tax=Acetomicrobium sp. S15 = DSM 107314 TaxID=2529858 RepID=UPI001E5ABE90